MKKLFIVMLSVFALILVGCSNPANSGSTSDPYLLGLDDCEVTLAAIEAGAPNGQVYDTTTIAYQEGYEPYITPGTSLYVHPTSILENNLSDNGCTDFKYYANADFSTIVMKYKDSSINMYIQYIKK